MFAMFGVVRGCSVFGRGVFWVEWVVMGSMGRGSCVVCVVATERSALLCVGLR